jgi:hypothetical protein
LLNPFSQIYQESRYVKIVALLGILATQPGVAQQYWCHYPNVQPWNGAAYEGNHSVMYNAYIPVDHVSGPTPCWTGYGLIYKGDPNAVLPGDYPIQTARVYNLINFRGGAVLQTYNDVGQTRNYSLGSPLNGTTLSSGDEDGVSGDCFLWNAAAYASTSNFHQDASFPYSTQGQAHNYGTASNPLESSLAKIAWDMRTLVDYSNPDFVTAYVNYNHTCFPAHIIKVDGHTVYNWVPPRTDTDYITGCLLFQQGKIIGQQTQSEHVPCDQ